MYDSMLQKLKEVGVASAMPVSNVRVINPAKLPIIPALPSKTLNAALGLFGGALIGIICGSLRQRSDRSLKLPGEASRLLGIPEIGLVPALRHDPYSRQNVFSRLRASKDSLTLGSLESAGLRTDRAVDLTMVGRSDSLMAEAYRGTLPAILFANEQRQLDTLVVSSANPGEGKTSLISNLAVGLAEMNKRVLLIDADVQNSRLHDVFGIPKGPGLAELLESSSGSEPGPGPVPTSVKRLSLLPSGEANAHTRNLLYSGRMSQLLARYKGQFDLILVDTAPVLHMRDARLIGRLADAVLLVVRAGQTSRDAASAAAARFREDGTPLLGVVLNDWNPKESPALYGNGYINGYRRYFKQQQQ
jgi:capsular exopolysaccharide synthesis family protein